MIRGGAWAGAWGLSWAGAWGDVWAARNRPFAELTPKEQVFVRSYLDAVYTRSVAQRIVTLSSLAGVTVLTAEQSLTATLSQDEQAIIQTRIAETCGHEPIKTAFISTSDRPVFASAKVAAVSVFITR